MVEDPRGCFRNIVSGDSPLYWGPLSAFALAGVLFDSNWLWVVIFAFCYWCFWCSLWDARESHQPSTPLVD